MVKDSLAQSAEVRLQLTQKEARQLLRLLEDHLHYGWIASDGEFDVVVDGMPSPTLVRVYDRLKREVTQ